MDLAQLRDETQLIPELEKHSLAVNQQLDLHMQSINDLKEKAKQVDVLTLKVDEDAKETNQELSSLRQAINALRMKMQTVDQLQVDAANRQVEIGQLRQNLDEMREKLAVIDVLVPKSQAASQDIEMMIKEIAALKNVTQQVNQLMSD